MLESVITVDSISFELDKNNKCRADDKELQFSLQRKHLKIILPWLKQSKLQQTQLYIQFIKHVTFTTKYLTPLSLIRSVFAGVLHELSHYAQMPER